MGIRDPATAKIGEEILPFEIETVPEYFLKKAEVELHDTPDRRAQGLREIKELAKNDKHTKNIEFDDDFLLQYLRVRKYNVARAFTQLKALVALKKKHPLMFTNFSYDKTVKTIFDKTMSILPWRCQDGCAILLIELDNWIPGEFPVEEVKRAAILYLLQSLRETMTQINGFKIIFDLKSNPLKHLKYCTPENIYLIYHGSQDCIAGRYKEFHAVNLSVTFKAVWFLIKPFLTDKIKKRVFLHNSPEALLNHFPRTVLPKQYGGDLENYDMSSWLKKAMAPEKLAVLGGRPRQVNES
ncbi:clavesin-1 [Caerostris darwini]|uniref:Clavesin-1 n=1 Tax=Caerostris darwini TaxID=1538125 RepID=A0AAV4RIC5_9ARAC|nr:clavesin-1 [Caerostris darwini]